MECPDHRRGLFRLLLPGEARREGVLRGVHEFFSGGVGRDAGIGAAESDHQALVQAENEPRVFHVCSVSHHDSRPGLVV